MLLSRARRALSLLPLLAVAHAQPLQLTPYDPDGIYGAGETVGWTVTLPEGAAAPAGVYSYTLKKNAATLIGFGTIDPKAGPVKIAATLDEPGFVHLEITPAVEGEKVQLAAAAVSPERLKPVVPRPADFDAFWAGKLKDLEAIAPEPVLLAAPSGKDGVDYATIKLKNIQGAHIYGQIAKPAREGRFPAMLQMQWAGGPYPLHKSWVVDRAAQGWLAMNVSAHDVPIDLPQAFYDALPRLLKDYAAINNDERDRNYFLRMYLGNYRALEYLAGRSDWNGQVLLATGTSMGGQQALNVAGLHPKVTHVIVHVPAGADSNAELGGRAPGYPNWDNSNPRVRETGLYFDAVNFAPRIRAKTLMSAGFIDTVCPPAGIYTVYNLIPGPKEIVPLVDAPHNHQATEAQQKPYIDRMNAWMDALARGNAPL